MKTISRTFCTLAAVLSLTSSGNAAVTVFQGDLPGFKAVVGELPIIDFDFVPLGTDLAGSTIKGVTFTSPLGNTLDVVEATATSSAGGFTPAGDTDNRLIRDCGTFVLSPGGALLVPGDDIREKDGLRLVLDTPVRDFGIDLLFQSADGNPQMSFELRNSAGTVIASGTPNIPALGNGPDPTSTYDQGGSFFIGFHSDQTDIAQIDFFEFDNNAHNPDSNIGYGTIRVVAACAQSGPYTFTQAGDSHFSSCEVLQSFFFPAINNTGSVVFNVYGMFGEQVTARGINGGPASTLAIGFSNLSRPTVNDAGAVAFAANVNSTGAFGIFATTIAGGTPTTVVDNGGQFNYFESPDLNSSGAVLSEAGLDPFDAVRGIYLDSVNGGPTTIVIDDSSIFHFQADPAITPDLNDTGTVAFRAEIDAGGEGVFTISSSGGPVTTLADTNNGGFLGFGSIAINNAGKVAFRGIGTALGEAVFTTPSTGGPLTVVADATGAFGSFDQVAINNAGKLAFVAALDVGGFGIFTGPDEIADRVIAIGDSLFCSVVTSVIFSKEGFNDAGQIAFRYELADGHSGIAVASPNQNQVLSLTNAVSRKTHGAAGPFDIDLLTNPPGLGVECRSSAGRHSFVFTFTNNVVSGSASITSGTGRVGAPTFTGTTMTVPLSGVTDVQTITMTLSNVTDSLGNILPTTAVSVNMLIGDTSGDKSVTNTDVTQTRGQVGVPVTASNFRDDVKPNGAISNADVSVVRSDVGHSLP